MSNNTNMNNFDTKELNKMANNVVKTYNDSSIKHFEGLEAVRNKPTIYIGALGSFGVLHLLKEAVGNVIDEYTSHRCKTGWVNIDTKNSTVEVIDDACGMPISKCKEIVSQMFTSGKYDKEDTGAYDFSIGTNGCGDKLINALSDKFIVETYRDGKRAYGEYEKGIEKKFEITDAPNHVTGTRIWYHPDITVLLDITMDATTILKMLEMLTYINPGFTFIVNINSKQYTFCHPEGMFGYMTESIIKKNRYRVLNQPIELSNEIKQVEEQVLPVPDGKGGTKEIKRTATVNMKYNVYFTWAENINYTLTESYVNGLRTVNDGSHVTGARMAITKAVKEYIDRNSLLPKNSKLEIDGNCVHESIILIVDARHSNPTYKTQVKDALDNIDIQFFMSSNIYKQFSTWLQNNTKQAQEICKLVIRSAKAKAAAAEARANVIKAGGKLQTITINPKKFNGCKSTDPDICELFIVEGDSAGGSARDARNTNNQAVFRIRGKIQNVLQSNDPPFSDELNQLVEILGCGKGDTFDINKLRFHKIIKAADADSDGDHISTLIDGFFFKYYKPIIEAGYLYEAKPPLYQLTFGHGANAKMAYIPNQNYFQKAVSAIATGAFELVTFDGKVISKDLAEKYIEHINGYKDFIKEYAVQINIDPELLEFIVRNYSDISCGKFDALNSLGYECNILTKSETYMHVNIDRDYEHYFVVLDNLFYKNVYQPVAKRLSEIYLMNVRFRGKKTGTLYGGSTCRNADFLNNLLMGKGISVRRLKGLGESCSQELRTYMFNTNTRVINKIHLKDVAEAEKAFDMFLGKDIANKKKLFEKDRSVVYEPDD